MTIRWHVALIVGMAADLVSTAHALGGGAAEANPVMAGIIAAGWSYAVLFKLAGGVALVWLLAALPARFERGMAAFYALAQWAVVGWNIAVALA